jgi:hypothetical protein
MLFTMLVLKISSGVTLNYSQTVMLVCMLNSVRNRISAAQSTSKAITPKLLIVSRRINNRWKGKKVFYNSCFCPIVRFSSEQSQSYNFWLLLAVKSELTSAPKFWFWNLLREFKDGHRHGVPAAWCDIHLISVVAYLIRWCQSTYMKA